MPSPPPSRTQLSQLLRTFRNGAPSPSERRKAGALARLTSTRQGEGGHGEAVADGAATEAGVPVGVWERRWEDFDRQCQSQGDARKGDGAATKRASKKKGWGARAHKVGLRSDTLDHDAPWARGAGGSPRHDVERAARAGKGAERAAGVVPSQHASNSPGAGTERSAAGEESQSSSTMAQRQPQAERSQECARRRASGTTTRRPGRVRRRAVYAAAAAAALLGLGLGAAASGRRWRESRATEDVASGRVESTSSRGAGAASAPGATRPSETLRAGSDERQAAGSTRDVSASQGASGTRAPEMASPRAPPVRGAGREGAAVAPSSQLVKDAETAWMAPLSSPSAKAVEPLKTGLGTKYGTIAGKENE